MDGIRGLRESDLPDLLALSALAGWNQTEADWLRLMHLATGGCLCLELEGRPVATASAIRYGVELAWIGMVLTHPDFRGRGYGSRLTAAAVEHARSRGVRTVGLDATEMGRPLYLRLGFRDAARIERWSGMALPAASAGPSPAGAEPRGPSAAPRSDPADPSPQGAPPWSGPGSPPFDAALDRAAFGADRSALLAALAAGEAAAEGSGFAMARAGARAFQLGPCVSRTSDAAGRLLGSILGRHPGQAFLWDLLPSNAAAASLAAELGFAPARRLSRMILGGSGAQTGLEGDHTMVYATAGFEYG